jgi:hypothetical protein
LTTIAELEAKAPLNFDNSARQSALGSAEGERALNFRARAVEIERLQIQQIKDVEKVGLYLKESAFAKQLSQAESLGNRHVNVKVARAAE